MEKEEVGFVLYRPDKVPGRFSGNQHSVPEIGCPGIVAEHFEIVSRSSLDSLPIHHLNELKEKGPLLRRSSPFSNLLTKRSVCLTRLAGHNVAEIVIASS